MTRAGKRVAFPEKEQLWNSRFYLQPRFPTKRSESVAAHRSDCARPEMPVNYGHHGSDRIKEILHPSTGAPFTQVDRTSFSLPARIVAATDSSTLLDAQDKSVPELSLAKIRALARQVRAVVVSNGGDLAPSNSRMWFAIADAIRIANKAVLDSIPAGSAPEG